MSPYRMILIGFRNVLSTVLNCTEYRTNSTFLFRIVLRTDIIDGPFCTTYRHYKYLPSMLQFLGLFILGFKALRVGLDFEGLSRIRILNIWWY